MLYIPHTSRSSSDSSLSSQNRIVKEPIEDGFVSKTYYDKLADQANSVSLTSIIKAYNINLPLGVNKITCPFKSHNNGNEKTPSFTIYTTNTFHCYGCHETGGPIKFVSKMDGISYVEAQDKILNLFTPNSKFVPEHTAISLDQLKILLEFSQIIREFRQFHPEEDAQLFIDGISYYFDQLFFKKKFNNETLMVVIDKFNSRIKKYSPQHKTVINV